MCFKSHMKSVAKAVSWRFVGAVDTFVLSYLMTGSPKAAVGIVGFEVFTKMFLFYGHERVWELEALKKVFGKSAPATH